MGEIIDRYRRVTLTGDSGEVVVCFSDEPALPIRVAQSSILDGGERCLGPVDRLDGSLRQPGKERRQAIGETEPQATPRGSSHDIGHAVLGKRNDGQETLPTINAVLRKDYRGNPEKQSMVLGHTGGIVNSGALQAARSISSSPGLATLECRYRHQAGQ
jgi:hypothetical protein